MGSGRWDPTDWQKYSTSKSYSTKTVDQIYNTSGLDENLDPKSVKIRESRDSDDNPDSTAIIVGLDVTGSMSSVLDAMAKTGLNTLVSEIYDRRPVSDPHVMCMGIGDAEMGDRAPLQVTQFEADIRIAEQLEKIYLERGGGGNGYESYALAWYFAATHTSTDCFEKRQKKGYLFTVGDEDPTPYLLKGDIERVCGDVVEADLKLHDILTMASRQWEIFHLVVEEGFNPQHRGDSIRQKWVDVLGERAIRLTDHTKMAEVIVSTIQVHEGADHNQVVDSWDGTTSLVVQEAVKSLKKGEKQSGVVTL